MKAYDFVKKVLEGNGSVKNLYIRLKKSGNTFLVAGMDEDSIRLLDRDRYTKRISPFNSNEVLGLSISNSVIRGITVTVDIGRDT